MRINASPIPVYSNGTVHQADRLQQEPVRPVVPEQERARQVVTPEQRSDPARRVAQQREILALERPASGQRQHHYYPFPDYRGQPASQQKALHTYSQNQHLSRIDSDGDFLGSIDVFA